MILAGYWPRGRSEATTICYFPEAHSLMLLAYLIKQEGSATTSVTPLWPVEVPINMLNQIRASAPGLLFP